MSAYALAQAVAVVDLVSLQLAACGGQFLTDTLVLGQERRIV
jgi:hypothetical protein